jgi:hypothetical protein
MCTGTVKAKEKRKKRKKKEKRKKEEKKGVSLVSSFTISAATAGE